MEFLTEQERHDFLNATSRSFCPQCGAAVEQNARGRRKKFCSDHCRMKWNHRNPRPENWTGTRTAVCPICGKEFLAYREYKTKRKYCSRACSNRGRAEERRNEHH